MPRTKLNNHVLDARPDRIDLRDRPYLPPLTNLPPQWPAEEDIDVFLPRYLSDGMILDQESEGACTGFGLAAVVNYLRWKRNLSLDSPPPKKVSERMAYHLARLYDEWPGEDYEGSSCRGAMKGWHHHGICESSFWRYRSSRYLPPKPGWERNAATNPLGAYYRIDQASIVDMQAAIYEVGAIYVSADVHDGWDRVRTSKKALVEIEYEPTVSGGHAFAIVGYEPRGFIIQNSWGPGWGYCGFAILSYIDWIENGYDAWVAVMGAAMKVPEAAVTRTRTTLQAQATGDGRRRLSSVSSTGPGSVASPWSESDAYLHSVVLGNEGRPLARLIAERDAESALANIGFTRPLEWLSGNRSPKIAIYAHGGLTDEQDAIEYTRVLAPYYAANGIYPLAITWKTGIRESLLSSLEDSVLRVFGSPAGALSEEWLLDRAEEARDRTIEVAAHRYLRFIWTEMKENAQAAAESGGGLSILARHLGRLAASVPDLEIHLVGFSAGAFVLGHLLDRFRGRGIEVRSMSLYAPACPMSFAARHFGRAFDAGILEKRNVHIDLLTDERERADSVGPYGMSILYLVSRALESAHKTPLLGLAAAWDPEGRSERYWTPDEPRSDLWNENTYDDIDEWLYVFDGGPRPTMHDVSRSKVFDGESWIDLGHRSFDNDVEVVSRTIARIRRGKLRHPVENLALEE